MNRVIQKLNGNSQAITLIVLLVTLLFTAGGWAYQLRQTATDIKDLEEKCVSKELMRSEIRALSKNVEDMHQEMIRLREYLMQRQ